MNSDKRKLAVNTGYLYLLTFSSFILGFITIPYQTRVLGPEVFGILGFAAAFQQYFSILIDFGFMLSATRLVTEHRDDKKYLGKLLTSVCVAKNILSLISLSICIGLSLFVERIMSHIYVILCYWLLTTLTCLTPDFVYRGLENMKIVTLRSVAVRLVFTLLIFVFLRKPEDYLMVPIFSAFGVLLSLGYIYWDLKEKQHITFQKTTVKDIFNCMKDSSQYFLSRIASTVYGATNALIIGLIYPTTTMLGYYTTAMKFKTMATQGCTPIADSLYPYMIRTRDYHSLYKIVAYIEVIIIFGCVIMGIFAKPICIFIFGAEYEYVGHVLLFILPCIMLVLPNYIFGFPALTPINQQKWANWSVEVAMGVQLIGIMILWLMKSLNVVNICCLTCLSEFIVFVIRFIVFTKNRKQFNLHK